MRIRDFSPWAVTLMVLLVLAAGQAQAQTTSAAAVDAGFPTRSIWASQTQATEGESITVFTVLYNSGTDDVKGNVVFEIDDTVINTKSFDVDTGSSEILSTSWIAQTGRHTASASIQEAIDGQTNATVNVTNATTGTVTITVAPAPPPSALGQVVSTAGAVIASSTPVAEDVAQSVYNAAENLRQDGITYLESQVASTTHQGTVLGTSTEYAGGTGGIGSSLGGWWSSLAALAIIVFSSPFLFYPAALFVCFVILYLLTALIGTSRHRRRF